MDETGKDSLNINTLVNSNAIIDKWMKMVNWPPKHVREVMGSSLVGDSVISLSHARVMFTNSSFTNSIIV